MSIPLRRSGLFQALLKGVSGQTISDRFWTSTENVTQKNNGENYLVTFPAHQIADEWYRSIVDSAPNNSESIKRISPEYYIYDASAMPIGQGIQQITKEFVVAGPLRYDQPTIYPALRYTNLVSGNWYVLIASFSFLNNKADPISKRFAIRSLEDPGLYWSHQPSDGSIVVSRVKRTYFQIWIVEPVKPAGTIMIGSDQVRMSLFHGEEQPVCREDSGLGFLYMSAGNARQVLQFKFAEFRSSFGSYQGNQVFYDPGISEEWELVWWPHSFAQLCSTFERDK